ncbi:MAG: TetR/AcrR family transcriptional regulator [Halioglobus sp.]
MAIAKVSGAKKERSSRSDWVSSALSLLGEEGVDAVTIDALSVRLGLTKGSFYWHFKGRQELLFAMAESWASTSTRDIHGQLRNSGLTEWEQLGELNRLSTQMGYGNIDRAMRIWAENSEETRAAVSQADHEILTFIEEKLTRIGLKPEDARVLSKMSHACSVGLFAVGPTLNLEEQSSFNTILVDVIERLKQ